MSSNNVLLLGAPEEGALLVDSSHRNHAAQTVALVQSRLAGRRLVRVLNTHLHSDHCGGNATLARHFGCELWIPPGQWDAVARWDEEALSYAATGQRCERFVPQGVVQPGAAFEWGGRRWMPLAAPGHDPHSLMLWNDSEGVLISADVLWERGFGILFPELDGEAAFDDQACMLDLIGQLAPRLVVPGHGRPFTDVPAALAVARERLAGFVADPARHARHGMRALLKFHLLEVREQSWPDLLAWFGGVSLYPRVWERLGRPEGSLEAFARRTVRELVQGGVLAEDGGVLRDA